MSVLTRYCVKVGKKEIVLYDLLATDNFLSLYKHFTIFSASSAAKWNYIWLSSLKNDNILYFSTSSVRHLNKNLL